MNDDLISKHDAIDAQEAYMADHPLDGYEDELALIDILRNLPSAQSEIIRCEDCMHNGSFDTDCPIDWNGKEFCNFAEREEDDVR